MGVSHGDFIGSSGWPERSMSERSMSDLSDVCPISGGTNCPMSDVRFARTIGQIGQIGHPVELGLSGDKLDRLC